MGLQLWLWVPLYFVVMRCRLQRFCLFGRVVVYFCVLYVVDIMLGAIFIYCGGCNCVRDIVLFDVVICLFCG